MTAAKSGAELVAGTLAHFGATSNIATAGVSAHKGDTAGAALGAANALQGMASLGGKLAGSLGVVGPLAVANISYAASLIAKDRRIKTCARWDVDGEEKVHGLVLQLFYEFRRYFAPPDWALSLSVVTGVSKRVHKKKVAQGDLF